MNNNLVTPEEILAARRAPLGDFLVNRYPMEFKLIGKNVINRNNPSYSVPLGISGYHDFKTGSHGNPIDYLMRYKEYTFTTAVRELNGFLEETACSSNKLISFKPFELPDAACKDFSLVYRFLSLHAIPVDVTDDLIRKGLLYQDIRNNAVFVSTEKDCCEVYGTGSTDYYRCLRAERNRYWAIPAQKSKIAYVCMNAIEALSLRCLKSKTDPSAMYVSIGGLNGAQAINRISAMFHTVLAFGDDDVGKLCRKSYPNLISICPRLRTWNDDLKNKAHVKE